MSLLLKPGAMQGRCSAGELCGSCSCRGAWAALKLQAARPTSASQSTFPSNKYLKIQRYLKYLERLVQPR